ncbi:peptidylprolyl isomerase [Advenella sp. S44]|uniref:peptidylprolyl isomerase n=1 Tax=Advenella sp. S44 TaxID=1982755 RepID=UPI000C29ED9F|nr:peptidylprolyl isomerase [Advenella sp. S44]PJX26002.1 peptidylprolyl isomerase [Advenella sp. S44]
MRKLGFMRTAVALAIPAILIAVPPFAQAQKAKNAGASQQRSPGQFADGIAAVVNNEIITMRELQQRMASNRVTTGGQNQVQQTVLQAMIDEKLMRQDAEQYGIRITDAQLSQAMANIAQRNNLPPEKLQPAIEQMGLNWDSYTRNLRNEMVMEELRTRIVQSRVDINESDIDAFLKQNPTGILPGMEAERQNQPKPPPQKQVVVERSFVPKAVALQHIYIRVPDNSPEDVVAAARKKADAAMAKLRGGTSFENVAKEYSDGAEAASGGDLGIRMFEDWPSLFVNVTKKVPDGRTTGVFKAPNGFHILKVVERRGLIQENKRVVTVQPPAPPPPPVPPIEKMAKQKGPVNITETKAKHILVKITPVFSDQQARAKIDDIRNQIEGGMSFEEAAKKFSQDTSAPLGGEIGWIPPGASDADFEKAMNALQPGQISAPVRSKFGWHLITVEDRRSSDKQPEIRRNLARQSLFQKRAEPVYEDWLQQLRAKAYIDNRLTQQKSRP